MVLDVIEDQSIHHLDNLNRALKSQFGPSPFDCPMVDLFKLQQNGTLSYYYLKFMALANRSGGLTEEVVLKCFISGLNVDIKCDVATMTPLNLLRVVSLAKFYEEKYTSIPKTSPSYTNRFNLIILFHSLQLITRKHT